MNNHVRSVTGLLHVHIYIYLHWTPAQLNQLLLLVITARTKAFSLEWSA